MALGKSAYLEGVYLDWRFALGSFASGHALKDELPISNQYIGLFKGDPEGAGVEVSGFGYARIPAGWGASNWTRTGSQVVNDNDLDFTPPSGGDWATVGDEITHVVVFDALSAGNMLDIAELDVPRVALDGDPVGFLAGTLVFEED